MPAKSAAPTPARTAPKRRAPRVYGRRAAERFTGKELLPFTNPRVEVRESAIHGLGLFAARRIRKDELIGIARGRHTQRNNDHVLWMEESDGEVWGIEPLNELRFTNHSDTPNAVFLDNELYALRAIAKGEEIAFDYDGGEED